MITVSHVDHLVLTVTDIPVTLEFYARVLGMQAIQYGENRIALKFGCHKINLHQAGEEFEPKAEQAIPGSADLCFISETDIETAVEYLQECDVDIIEGPVQRTGATGKLLSIYIRDPDGNLIEISNRVQGADG